jgi:hypothetical protein
VPALRDRVGDLALGSRRIHPGDGTGDGAEGRVSDAVLSSCGTYRYTLERDLGRPLLKGPARRVLFVMLNPSTADATKDDPTIRRCAGFARSWNYSALAVVNLFAWRATDPAQLMRAADRGENVVGPDNDYYTQREAMRADLVVLAWGALPPSLQPRSVWVARLIAKPVAILGLTKRTGHPRHPLYVPGHVTPIEWRDGAGA